MTFLVIATSVGVLWATFLVYEIWKNRKTQSDFERRLEYEMNVEGASPPYWLMKMRETSLMRFYNTKQKAQERFDGIMVHFRSIEPLCSYNSVDKIGTESYRFHKIPVKGGEDDMAKGKSPKKETKKPKKSKKK